MRITKVTIEGKTYPLIFSLNAAEKIEDQCVPVRYLGKCLIKPEEFGKNGITVVKDVLYNLALEGSRYCAAKEIDEIDGAKVSAELPEKDALYADLDYAVITDLTRAIYECLADSKKKE